MAKEDGINVLLQIGDGGVSEVFTTLPGQTSTTLARAGAAIDASDKDSTWTQTLAGKKSAQVTCTGHVKWPDTAGLVRLETQYNAQQPVNCRLIVNQAGDYYQGPFVIAQLDLGGDDGVATNYSLTLQNADDIIKTLV